MTPKQRQLATIRHEPTDRISLDTICIENVPQVAALLGCAEADVYDRLGIDGRVVAAGYVGDARPSHQAGCLDGEHRRSVSSGDELHNDNVGAGLR